MHIKIGEVETLLTEDWDIIPDDRQTQIETIGGKVIQDLDLSRIMKIIPVPSL